ncbi:MAG: hypothetical protein ACREJ4_02590 [Candidatus Methylomirabilaceae bacterium]
MPLLSYDKSEACLRRWQRIFGLETWTIKLMREPPPQPRKHAAFTDFDWAARTAKVWARTERQVIHELVHIAAGGLGDVFWRTFSRNGLAAEWDREHERLAERLERAVMLAIAEGKARAADASQ